MEKKKNDQDTKFPTKNNEAMELKNTVDNRTRGDIEALSASNNSGSTNERWIGPIHKIREKKKLHNEALDLLQLLCNEIIRLDFSIADRIFRLPLQKATSLGIHEIVEQILKSYPYAVSLENDVKHSIFQRAILFRQEKVFSLIGLLEEYKVMVFSKRDKYNDNALHLAGLMPPSKILDRTAGAALQMQREWQWFKEVGRLALPENREEKNREEKTPEEVFNDTHKKLMKEGEKWMKGTATSCTLIASLIATVVFAAAIQVPGGNNENGRPIFYQQRAFIIFGISNALALFSSIASVLWFLSILVSRYAAEDFLFTLPHRMNMGLVSLFVSILSTMIAFGCILYLVFGENKGWILIPVIALGCYPVYLFMVLQFPLLKDMMKSTYGSGIFAKQSDCMLQ